MKEKSKRIIENKAITLIALVVTIVVLIILAGISIGALTGNNGIINQTQNAKEQTEIADEKERIDLSTVGAVGKEPRGELKRNYFNEELTEHIGKEGKDYSLSESENAPFIVEYLDSKRSYLVDEDGNITGPLITPEETEEPETGGSIDTMLYGVIEIKWLMGDTNFVSETANAPVIKKDIPNTTMKLVKYENGNWVEGTDYDYKAGNGTEDNRESRWANAEVEIDYGEGNQKIKSYFVWIPRYAYRIIYFKNDPSKAEYLNGTITEDEAIKEGKIIGYSDSRGIVSIDTEGKVKKVSGTTSLNIGGNYFRVHPAFIDDSKNNYENGGWDEELPGIWVGKYETSLVNKSDGRNINTNSTTAGDKIVDSENNTDKAIAVQPNMRSWRYCTISNQYTSAKAYNTNLNSHMLKNSEWGAVAYLTESKYGRNATEVAKDDNSSFITADAGISANPEQSSTGNETGIYGLRGGAEDIVATYYTGGNQTYLNNGISLVNDYANESTKKYVTAYTGINDSIDYKVGDATYETSDWYSDVSAFVDSNVPFFKRGGSSEYSLLGTGVFSYFRTSGNASGNVLKNNYESFRMCLAVK